MAGGLLGTAISGLRVFQRNLDTVSHNIANVNTEGYSRQRVNSAAREPQITGAGYVGQGVHTVSVNRVYDEFLNNQVVSSTSAFKELESFHGLSSEIDNFIAEGSTSLSPALQAFFDSVQEVADDPTSIPAREVMLSEARTLSDRFVTMSNRLESLQARTNSNLSDIVDEVNTLTGSIAEYNEKIVIATGLAGGKPPNDLLDQRDVFLAQLAEKVDVTTVDQDDGSMNVFIGNGQAVVLGTTASSLGIQDSGLIPGRKDITFNGPQASVVITDNLTGGELGGNLRFLQGNLESAQKEIGRVAAGLIADFNAQHQGGFDLNGNTGVAFFGNVTPTVIGLPTNTGAVQVGISDVNQLEASDYRLDYDGTDYTLTRLNDNSQTILGAPFPGSATVVDGLSILESVPMAAGDRVLIQPTQETARQMTVAISDPAGVAAADADTSTGAVGNNLNALAMAGLQNNRNLLNGTATYHDAYGQTVARVGTSVQAAEINLTAQEGLLTQAREARESVSGVNLDEEAANLVKFQQAYQAAAQMVSVSNTLFDTLLGAFRR